MPSTATHAIPYPNGSDNPGLVAHLQALAVKIDAELEDIDLNQVNNGTGGQIIVCNSSGVPTYRTATGDVTVSNTGDLQIAGSAVGTSEVANLAVTGAKIDNATIGRSKLTAATIQTKRAYTPSIAAGTGGFVTLTWDTPFADANYTVSLTTRSTDMSVDRVQIITQSAASIYVAVLNGNTSGAAVFAEVQAIAIHD